MKKNILITVILVLGLITGLVAQESETIKPEHLTVETFKEKVFNYEKNPDNWVFEGDLPCIVDFYADWTYTK
jgi:hypothetical protein